MAKKRVAVLISGRGSNMASLIEAAKERSYPAEIALVVSNRPEAPGLARAQVHAIPTAVVDHRPHGKDRAAFERALQAELDAIEGSIPLENVGATQHAGTGNRTP